MANILLIHQIFVTPEEPGGTRHYELCRYLAQKGHQITVIASSIDYLTGRKKEKTQEVRDNINIIYSYAYQAVHKSFISRAFSFLSFSVSSFFKGLFTSKLDVVWATSPPLFQAFTAFLIAKLRRKKFVFEVRDLWIDFAVDLGIVKNYFIIKTVKMIEKMMYHFSDVIIVNSPGFIQYIEKHTNRDKVYLIPNGVITKDFAIKKEVPKIWKESFLDDKFVAIYIGNIGVANDVEAILEAAKHLEEYPDIRIVFMGGGIKRSFVQEAVKTSKNVVLLPAQPKCEIPKILSCSNVGIATLKNIPLFSTTYPNKVFDYMAAQIPTILAIDGVIREVIEKAEGGICISPGDSQSLSEAILHYRNNSDLCKSHGVNALRYVKENFEREDIAKNLMQLFDTLANELIKTGNK